MRSLFAKRFIKTAKIKNSGVVLPSSWSWWRSKNFAEKHAMLWTDETPVFLPIAQHHVAQNTIDL